MAFAIALLGRSDTPVDGVADYCAFVGRALADREIDLKIVRVPWAEKGWITALRQLNLECKKWAGHWVIVQYTALSWSRRGFPFLALAVVAVLRRGGTRVAVVFHESHRQRIVSSRLIDRVRGACQDWVIRSLYRSAAKSIFTLPLKTVAWLPGNHDEAAFIPIGASLAPSPSSPPSEAEHGHSATSTVIVFCLDAMPALREQLQDISAAVSVAAKSGTRFRVVFVGRGTKEAAADISKIFGRLPVEISILGLLSPEALTDTFASAQAMLCVRGMVNQCRSSVIAGIACGLPIVAYGGDVEGTPLADAGLMLVPYRDTEALGAALFTRLDGPQSFTGTSGKKPFRAPEDLFVGFYRRLLRRFSEGRRHLRISNVLSPRALTPTASAHLDLFRGLAAWAVMWGHLRALFFVDFPQVQNRGLLLAVLYFVTGFGSEAVLVFFVLSGFLISSAILGRTATRSWSWRDYAIDRSSRLYVVLIPGLLLGFLWDRLGSNIFASTGVYSHPLASFADLVVQSQMRVGVLLGNMFFLQTIVCPTFGSNAPLWSLANEFWYYVLFPIALAAGIAWKQRSTVSAAAFTMVTVFVAVFVGWHILAGFLIWLAGTGLVIAYARCPAPSRNHLIWFMVMSSIVLSVCLIGARTGKFTSIIGNTGVGFAFALFLFGVLYMDFGNASAAYSTTARFVAGFSYSLYVLHFPLLLFLRAWLVPPQRWEPDAIHLFGGLLVGTVTLGFAWLVSTFTESKTRVVRQWMRSVVPALEHPPN